MECRTSLFINASSKEKATPQPPPPPVSLYESRLHHKSSGRFHPEIVNKPPPRKVEELIPLPLPRNLLLLQMMDAAEREKKAKHAKTKGMQLNQTESEESIITLSYSDESESEDSNFSLDNDKVKVGVDAISSAAGTYAVSDENGVRISRERPHRFQERWPTSNSSGSLCRDSKINFVMSTEKKVDSGFQKSAELVIPLSENTDTLEIITKHDKNDASGDVPELTNDFEKSDIDDDEMNGNYLKYGVRVQVVDMQHGHAKLARNRGYVAVSNSRLVKVGGPQDAACEIEGLLNSAVSKRNAIGRKLCELNKMEVSLGVTLGNVLSEPCSLSDYTSRMSCADRSQVSSTKGTVSFSDSGLPKFCTSDDEDAPTSPLSISPARSPMQYNKNYNSRERHFEITEKPYSLQYPPTPPPTLRRTSQYDLDIMKDKQKHDNDKNVGCLNFFSVSDTEDEEWSSIDRICDYSNQIQSSSFSYSSPVRRQSPGGINSPTHNGSVTGMVDTRGGYSNYPGINISKANTETPKRGEIRMYGEHRGLARLRQVPKPGSFQVRKNALGVTAELKSPFLSTKTW